MNEEQLVDLLANHLDALLKGEPFSEPPPDEIAELLQIAQNLTEAAPVPAPEFGPALKESLLGPASGGNGATGTGGSALGGHQITFMLMMAIFVVGTVLSLLAGAVITSAARSTISETSSPTPPTVQYQATPASTLEAPATNQVADSLTFPSPTATAVLDILPVVTVTVGAIEELSIPPGLVPGPSGSGNGSGDRSGDHDRGHGNDSDHHDEDNPGRNRH